MGLMRKPFRIRYFGRALLWIGSIGFALSSSFGVYSSSKASSVSERLSEIKRESINHIISLVDAEAVVDEACANLRNVNEHEFINGGELWLSEKADLYLRALHKREVVLEKVISRQEEMRTEGERDLSKYNFYTSRREISNAVSTASIVTGAVGVLLYAPRRRETIVSSKP